MKKRKVISLLFLVTFLIACTQSNNQSSYIIPVSQKEVVRPATSSYLVELYVMNTNLDTFIGNLTYTYDNCLSIVHGEDTDTIQIPPKQRLGFNKEFIHTTEDRFGRPDNLREECLQKPLPIHVELFDASGDLRSTADFVVTLTPIQ